MAWIKRASNYQGDWYAFDLTAIGLGKIAIYSLLLGLAWGLVVAKGFGLPGDKVRAAMKEHARSAAIPDADAGSCRSDYTAWAKMPEGPQKASKLVYFKKAYGTLNFHDNCVGNPRPVPAAEAIQ